MQASRVTSSCSSACSTSGRQSQKAVVVFSSRRRSLVRAQARKLKGKGQSLLTSIPAGAIITEHPTQLDDVTVGLSTLASSDSEPDVELLPLLGPENDDAMSTVDEINPYTTADALSTPVEGLAGGEPALEALLAESGSDLSADRICAIFPFPLDQFQRRALELFLEGRSVVVCAPTGAGKTAIAEAAAAATLARGQRVIYTTPLKALSNQKLFETRRRFGHVRCGLQTGDASLNPDADIVVMTTEILRNIMYRTAELAEENNTGSQSTREARLGDVGLIVLDEVHYLGDPHRGSVWEEIIINCPRHIQLLAMSATVRNPQDLGDWIAKEHMPCETIQTRFRPVPLHWHFAYYKPPKGARLDDLLVTLPSGKQALNPSLSNRRVLMEEARAMLSGRWGKGDGAKAGEEGGGYVSGGNGGARRGRWGKGAGGPSSPSPGAWDLEDQVAELMEKDPQGLQRRVNLRRTPDTGRTIRLLSNADMLPAIWFILSRRDCDMNAVRAATAPLTRPEEQAAIAAEVAALRADQPEAVREELVPALISGIASHHAGQLPGWKSLVERLFQRGLLRLVFATGTLAAGINMPARTTVISSLSRRTEEGHRLLPHNELLQMAGRAGRRGFDTEGNCVVLQNKFEVAEDAWQILRHGPEPLVSQFSISYGLVLNLLSVNTLDQAREFVSRSFGTFVATEGNSRREAEAEALEAKARGLLESFKALATARAKELNARVKEAKDELRRLKSAQLAAQCAAARQMLEQQREQGEEEEGVGPAGQGQQAGGEATGRLGRDGNGNGANAWQEGEEVAGDVRAVGEPGEQRSMRRPLPQPRLVVLNLAAGGSAAGASSGGRGRGGGGDGRPVLMPALLVGEIEPPPVVVAATGAAGAGKETPPLPYYACLAADNRLMRASVACVAGVLEGPMGEAGEEDVEKVWAAVRAVRPNAWSNVEAGSFALQAALGTPTTSAVTRQLQTRLPWTFVQVDQQMAAQVAAARQSVKAALAELELQRKMATNAAGGPGKDGWLEKMARAKNLLKKAEKLRAECRAEGQLDSTWKTFQSTMEILMCVDALEKDSLRVMPLGLLARNIQGGNELWLAMALSHPALHALPGPALGAMLGALLSPEVLSKPVAVWAAYPVSPAVEAAVEALEPSRQLLLELQSDAGLTRWNDALLVDLRFAGLVEAWASGASWSQIMSDSNLDDGDMARLLIRTIDLLKQLQHNAHLLPELREAAAEALRGMDRKPVAELTF